MKVGTCAHDRRVIQELALNVHVKPSDLTWSGSGMSILTERSPGCNCQLSVDRSMLLEWI